MHNNESVSHWLAVGIRAALLALIVSQAAGAENDDELQLRIEGPPGQWVSVAVRSFSGTGQQIRWKTNQQRLQLEDGSGAISLEAGRAGYAIDIFVPTNRETKIQLRRGDKVLSAKSTSRMGHTMVRSGRVGSLENLRAAEIALKPADQRRIRQLLDAIDNGNSRQVISTSDFANIDAPSLDAFVELSKVLFGKRKPDLQGWVKWSGKKQSTIYAGIVSYQRATADLVLVTIDGNLVDFVIQSDLLPEIWHTGPAAIRQYSEVATKLLRLMFSGDLEEAHKLFSFRVRDQITIEKLIPVHQSVATRYGSSLKSVALRDHRLEQADDEKDRKLILLFDLVTDRDTLCNGRVEVFLDHVNGLVPRGHIASFNVQEKGPAIPAAAKQKVAAIVTALLLGDSDPLTSQLPEPLSQYVAQQELSREIGRWQEHYGQLQQPIDWSQWTSTDGKKGVQGPAVCAGGEAKIRVDFGRDKILGVTISGDDYAGSTLSCVRENEAMSQHATAFWRHMFSKEFDAAYDMLPKIFQKQLPREKFLKSSAGLAKIRAGVADVTVRSIRFNTKPDRVATAMIEVICMLRFANDTYEAVKSEYNIRDNGEFELYTFNTEFSGEFPVPFDSRNDFMDAIVTGNAQRLTALFHQSHRKEIDEESVQALLFEIRKQWGGLDLSSVSGVATRVYNGASDEVTKVTAKLPFDNALVTTHWTYVYDHLKSFHFASDEVARFPQNIKDTSKYRERSEELFTHWFEGDVEDAMKMLIPEAQNQTTVTKMKKAKLEIEQKLGKFQSIEFQSESWIDETNSLRQRFQVQFEKGGATASTTFSFDALHSMLVAANVSNRGQSSAKNSRAEE